MRDNSPMRHILVGAVVLRADGSGGARHGDDVDDGNGGNFSATVTMTAPRYGYANTRCATRAREQCTKTMMRMMTDGENAAARRQRRYFPDARATKLQSHRRSSRRRGSGPPLTTFHRHDRPHAVEVERERERERERKIKENPEGDG